MRTRGALRAKALGRLNALVAETGGATAVEFAMLAIPFVTMIFCLMELAVIFMISMTLDDAAVQASREIRTGQLQSAGGATQASFAAKICSHMAWIQSTCNANLSVDVETYPSFAAVNPPNPISNGVFSTTNLKFVPGGPQDIVVVRAYFRWQLITPFLSQAVNKLSNGQAVITSTTTFRNEPYQ
jgi:Flp pilus assembly protein TadG